MCRCGIRKYISKKILKVQLPGKRQKEKNKKKINKCCYYYIHLVVAKIKDVKEGGK